MLSNGLKFRLHSQLVGSRLFFVMWSWYFNSTSPSSYVLLNLFRMGERGQKGPLPSFSPVTSTNVGITSRNFLTFSFNPFFIIVENFKFAPSASPKLSNLNPDHPSKKQFFWSNSYKIEVMITSLIEMLELQKFGHMTTSTI